MQVDIYVITLPNGKQYVGQARVINDKKGGGFQRRWKDHIRCSNQQIPEGLFHRALKKYGACNCLVDVIVTIDSELANEYEDMFIDLYDTLSPNGYNLVKGNGNGHRILSTTTRDKLSQSLMGHCVSAETREKIAESRRGKTTSEHTKSLISKASRECARGQDWEENKAMSKKRRLGNEHLPLYIQQLPPRTGVHGFKVAYLGKTSFITQPKDVPLEQVLKSAKFYLLALMNPMR